MAEYEAVLKDFQKLGLTDGGFYHKELTENRKEEEVEAVKQELAKLFAEASLPKGPFERAKKRIDDSAKRGGMTKAVQAAQTRVKVMKNAQKINGLIQACDEIIAQWSTIKRLAQVRLHTVEDVELGGADALFEDLEEALSEVVLDEGILKALTTKLVDLIKRLAGGDVAKDDKGFLKKLTGLLTLRKEGVELEKEKEDVAPQEDVVPEPEIS
jgi:hypothetical protein